MGLRLASVVWDLGLAPAPLFAVPGAAGRGPYPAVPRCASSSRCSNTRGLGKYLPSLLLGRLSQRERKAAQAALAALSLHWPPWPGCWDGPRGGLGVSTWVFLVKTGLFMVPVALAAAGLTPMDLLARGSPTAPRPHGDFGGAQPPALPSPALF